MDPVMAIRSMSGFFQSTGRRGPLARRFVGMCAVAAAAGLAACGGDATTPVSAPGALAIPNRLHYLDGRGFNLHPLVP
jgi:hypothetical protein